MRRKLIIGLCILVVLLAGIGIYLRNGFYGNCVPERRSLYVRSGSEYRTLEDSLDAAIAHTAFFRFYAAISNSTGRSNPGTTCWNRE